MAMSKSIAIIGAGPSGLSLATILHRNNIKTIIYESEQSADVRSQGGSLDLHTTSGQRALREAGLFQEFLKHARYDGEDMVLCDKTGKRHFEIVNTERGRPEIERIKLRQILIDSLPEGTIKWGHRVKRVEIGAIYFENGTVVSDCDLIIGADGAWSKVRPLLTHIPPFYSGISGLDIRLADVNRRHPEISAMVGNGSLFAFGESERQVLLVQRNGDGSLRAYAVGSRPERWIKECGINFNDIEEVKKVFLKEYENWAPELKRIIQDIQGDDSITPRALYMLPVGLEWPHLHGVTLLGDAAHLMTPFSGEGVNQAMQDALELALNIIKYPDDLDRAVSEYEVGMFPRARNATQRTWDSLQQRFAAGGLDKFKKRLESHLAAHQEKEKNSGKSD